MKYMTKTIELAGNSYEIGKKLGEMTSSIPQLKNVYTAGFPGFDEADVAEARALFERWCPGLNEELEGFADALGVPAKQISYYANTNLHPNCSQIAVLPSMTECGEVLVARSYEFQPDMEDFTLARTSVTGKYTHLGTTVLQFGREDGFNEWGLSVTMSSCGFPVGAQPNMRRPRIAGLQYWAVIRSVLENCKDVEEALSYVKEMPIAYNLNMILADKTGHMALVEILDGRKEVKQISEKSEEWYLCATNHPVLPELIACEPMAMRHSLVRYHWIRKTMDQAGPVNQEQLKKMLMSRFPEGLCCPYYNDFFGTTKSMVIRPASGKIELCWGGEDGGRWEEYEIHKPLTCGVREIEIHSESFEPTQGEFLPIE